MSLRTSNGLSGCFDNRNNNSDQIGCSLLDSYSAVAIQNKLLPEGYSRHRPKRKKAMKPETPPIPHHIVHVVQNAKEQWQHNHDAETGSWPRAHIPML
jgi:hypothetical protein